MPVDTFSTFSVMERQDSLDVGDSRQRKDCNPRAAPSVGKPGPRVEKFWKAAPSGSWDDGSVESSMSKSFKRSFLAPRQS